MVEGLNLNLIPSDAIGILARSNDNPLELRESSSAAVLVPLTISGVDTITLSQGTAHELSGLTYLGGIVSSDRNTVFWVNTSQPLP